MFPWNTTIHINDDSFIWIHWFIDFIEFISDDLEIGMKNVFLRWPKTAYKIKVKVKKQMSFSMSLGKDFSWLLTRFLSLLSNYLLDCQVAISSNFLMGFCWQRLPKTSCISFMPKIIFILLFHFFINERRHFLRWGHIEIFCFDGPNKCCV